MPRTAGVSVRADSGDVVTGVHTPKLFDDCQQLDEITWTERERRLRGGVLFLIGQVTARTIAAQVAQETGQFTASDLTLTSSTHFSDWSGVSSKSNSSPTPLTNDRLQKNTDATPPAFRELGYTTPSNARDS